MNIKGKTALITGSSRGIGKSIAIELAKRGANIVINYSQNEEEAEKTVKSIQNHKVKVIAEKADVGVKQDIINMSKSISNKFGEIDILVNNAGVIKKPGNWDSISDNDLDRTIDVNLKGTMYCIQEFAPHMKKKGSGAIINISSTYAFKGSAQVLAYTSAKAAIISLTKAMAKELGEKNISVNAIAPGNIDTEMTQAAGQEMIDWCISTTPFSRLGKPEEIAEAAIFLIESTFITGHLLIVDGGQSLNI